MDENKNKDQHYQPQYQAPASKASNPGKTGFILGLISTILMPLFYNPFMLWMVWVIAIIGLVYSIKGLKITPRRLAVVGLILSVFPIAFPIIARFILR